MDETADDSKDECALTVGSLFSGIGGLDLGFERAGFEIAWQCEKDPYCQKVLNKHWPNPPTYEDIHDLHRASGPEPEADILIGGFPCQDISYAGKGAGLDGERSGLWWEYARLIRVLGPRYAILENVPALVNRGLQSILGWLAEVGYDAEWQTLSAAQFGRPHLRNRLFIAAYPDSYGLERLWPAQQQIQQSLPAQKSKDRELRPSPRRPLWKSEPKMDRVGDGVPDWVDRIRGIGNAVVPQVAQFVAECVREHAARTRDPQREK